MALPDLRKMLTIDASQIDVSELITGVDRPIRAHRNLTFYTAAGRKSITVPRH